MEDRIRDARFTILDALHEHADLMWTVSKVNASACIDGPTQLIILTVDIETGRWVTIAVKIVDGSSEIRQWEHDPQPPIMHAESLARAHTDS